MPSNKEKFDFFDSELARHHIGNRTQSTAMLAWFLETVWRMEAEEIEDSICDGGGDKGIDAIHLDEDAQEITIFQAKRRNNPDATQGDADLRAFAGVSAYFTSKNGIDSLMSSGPNEELRKLITRLGLREKLEAGRYTVRLVFVTNAPLDAAGSDYVSAYAERTPTLEVWSRDQNIAVAERTKNLAVQNVEIRLPVSSEIIHERLSDDARLAVALVPATELVKLPGIDDLTIFELNVRLSLGKTRINRELGATVKQPSEHPIFPAYHNGLTLLTRQIEVDEGEIQLKGISVVNGCQSLIALYENRRSLTPQLQILVKVVELGESKVLVDKITYRTNNQNPVNTRDLRSTHQIQRDLQTQVRSHYGEKLDYAIRSGEPPHAPEVLDNATAAQLIMAVYLHEPWNAVRKVRLFDQEYHRVFNRHLDGHKLYFLHHLNKLVISKKSGLRADLEASFASVRFTLLYLLAALLGTTDEGARLIEEPQRWLPEKFDEVISELDELANEVVLSLNLYVEVREEEARESSTLFDPKVVFKSKAGVQPLEGDVLSVARRGKLRDSKYGFHVHPVR